MLGVVYMHSLGTAFAFSASARAFRNVGPRVKRAVRAATRPPPNIQFNTTLVSITHTGLSGQSLFAGILTRKQPDEPLDKARIGNTVGHKGRTEPITQRDIPRGISDKARIQPP